ncbi:MAG: hypothetical protein AB7G12_01150 [Thermoanaerobaculia bacterium]
MRIARARLGSRLGAVAGIAGLALVALSSCSKQADPVASLAVESSELELPFPGFTSLTYSLKPAEPLPAGARPQLFLHLLDEPGSVIRTFDQPLAEEWEVGREIRHTVRLAQSALAEPLEAGNYLLTAGLYDPDGDRFPLRTRAKAVARMEYQVATVHVPVAGGALPNVRFSEGWLEATPGTDRQILVRRSLAGAGPATLQIGPLRGPGELLLRLAPAPGVALARTELLGGSNQPRVHLRSSCGGVEAELSGELGVETVLEVPATETEVSCDIEIGANFTARVGADGSPRSTALELLAWRAGAADE